MTSRHLILFLAISLPTSHAALATTGCPGNVASLPFRVVNRHQIIIPVSINHQGPFGFLLDTGTQITMVAPALAAALDLDSQGEATVASAGVKATATFTQIGLVEVGSHSVAGQKALVYDLENLQASGLNIQGVLGEDFLQHFDMLIDNKNNMVCLDSTDAMNAEVKGTHIQLLATVPSTESKGLPNSLIISAKLSDGMRPIRLKLDSGANTPFLYNTDDYMALGAYRGATVHGGGANGGHQNFEVLPPQTITIGSVEVHKASFVTLAGVRKDAHTASFDGLLTIGFFKRVFINHADNFAILDPW